MSEHRAFPVPFSESEQKKRPNATIYCQFYGMYALMSEDWPPDLKGYKNTEEVYEECLNSGRTWQEVLDFKGYDPDILL